MDANPKAGGRDSPPDLQSRSAPVIERAPLPMVEVEGRDHIVCFVNSAFCHLLKKSREDLIGNPFAEIVRGGSGCVPLLDRVYRTGEPQTHAEKDDSESDPAVWLYAMWPALDADARPERVIVQLTKAAHFRENVAAMNEALLITGLREHELREAAEKSNAQMQIEITERKRAEQALQEARARLLSNADKLEQMVAKRTAELRASMGELEAFSYSLVHDLRAPVRAIHGFTQLALEKFEDGAGPAAVEHLNRVIKAAVRMDSLIQDVLTLSQVIRRPVELRSIDVDALVRSLIDERPELSPPLANIKIESPLLRVMGHEATLSQCLTNLLSNAVKFVQPGVVPWVRVWSEELPTATLPAARGSGTNPGGLLPPAGPVVRLWVEDHGIGIAAKSHETIFEIFQRLHGNMQYEGSGIGLAIVRKAIERMGGRVGVESEQGRGSRFWLEVPKG